MGRLLSSLSLLSMSYHPLCWKETDMANLGLCDHCEKEPAIFVGDFPHPDGKKTVRAKVCEECQHVAPKEVARAILFKIAQIKAASPTLAVPA